MNSEWVKNLNVRPATLKLLQERIREALDHVSIGNDFLIRTSIVRTLEK
jgi:hypothetical protein